MAIAIGISTKIKDALNMIDHEGVPPLITFRGGVYVLSTEGRDLGSLYYTRFANANTAEYSVTIPFSFRDMVGELLEKGDNLRAHLPPMITDLPPAGYSMFYKSGPQPDQLNQ